MALLKAYSLTTLTFIANLNLYRPSAVAFARVLIDLPLIAFQHVVFILPFYFLARLQIDAGKFFFFYLTLFLSTVNFSNLLRAFAYYVSSLDDCKYSTVPIIAEKKLIMPFARLSLWWYRLYSLHLICRLFDPTYQHAKHLRMDSLH